MAISGIVVTLSPGNQEKVLHQLEDDPRVTIGGRNGLKLPAVIDTDSTREYRACWESIAALPGVAHIDLVCVHYD